MSTPTQQLAYAPSQGLSKIPSFVFKTTDPTSQDNAFALYSGWVNTTTKGIWYLESLAAASGVISATWRAVGPIVTSTSDPAPSDYQYPIGQTWVNTSGDNYFVLTSITGTTAHWIELSAGSASVDLFVVDAATAPGTNPVGPDGSGQVTLTGAQVATGTIGTNVIRTDSLAANSITIEIQRTTTAATTDATKNGVSHFSSSQFSVDTNGFVTLLGGTEAIDSIGVDSTTGGGTNPVLPTAAGLVTIKGATPLAGTAPVKVVSPSVNNAEVQVQISQALAAADATKIGLCNFHSSHFTVTSTGFVTLNTSNLGIVVTVFTSSGNYTPASNLVSALIEVVGGGGGGGGATTLNMGDQIAAGAGGGGGGYARALFSAATLGTSPISVTIGAAGTGGIGSGAINGVAGGTTSVGAFISASGGAGGKGEPNGSSSGCGQPGTLGGTGVLSGSEIANSGFLTKGSPGGCSLGINTVIFAGVGGSSFFGGGAAPVMSISGNFTGLNALSYGGGGGGGCFSGAPSQIDGGAGFDGIVVITEYTLL